MELDNEVDSGRWDTSRSLDYSVMENLSDELSLPLSFDFGIFSHRKGRVIANLTVPDSTLVGPDGLQGISF